MSIIKKALLVSMILFMSFSAGKMVMQYGARKALLDYKSERIDCIKPMVKDRSKFKANLCSFYFMPEKECSLPSNWIQSYILWEIEQCMYEKGYK